MMASSLHSRLGLRVVEAGEGTATVELAPAAGEADASLALIAAVVQAAIDEAVRAAVPSTVRAFPFDLKLSRARPLPPGTPARATATIVHRGRTTAVALCRVTTATDAETLIATATGTASLRA